MEISKYFTALKKDVKGWLLIFNHKYCLPSDKYWCCLIFFILIMTFSESILAKPILIGNIKLGSWAYGVTVVGDYAYVASNADGLQIVNIANPATPFLTGNLKTGSAYNVTVVDKFAYVADGDSGLKIINIANPTMPVLIGSYHSLGGAANDVKVIGNYAYVASGTAGLKIVNITNPASPVLVGGLRLNGCAKGVAIINNYAYVADDNNGNGSGLRVVDIVNPTVPTLVGSLNLDGNTDEITIIGNYAYVANGGYGLSIINIANPKAPIFSWKFKNK